eukprot:3971741-Ditylum_brightwellii.AAC.1
MPVHMVVPPPRTEDGLNMQTNGKKIKGKATAVPCPITGRLGFLSSGMYFHSQMHFLVRDMH